MNQSKESSNLKKTSQDKYNSWNLSNFAGTIIKKLIFTKKGQISLLDQLIMYFGVFLGVYFSSILENSKSDKNPVIAAVISFLIIPYVYEKLKIDPDAPLIIRFSLFFQNGVFWEVILESISKNF